jgi:bifunctional non-homologous end joining protein LigD
MLKYCYPNLPQWIDHSTVDNYKAEYIAERKKNGWRCLAVKDDRGLVLWTRRHTIINDPLPITRGMLEKLPSGTVIDGELIDKRTKGTKDHYYAFDIQFYKGKSVMNLPWHQRRVALVNVLIFSHADVEISEPVQLGFSELYRLAIRTGDEGIVIKNINSKYVVDLKNCPVNSGWFKAKAPEKCFVEEK